MTEQVIENNIEKGTISVEMENIFPIIKKWLYSDKEIFLRELVSNAMDAINKLKHLEVIKEFKGHDQEYQIEIKINKNDGTLSVIDNGIGMTAEEIKKYINQVAFSGAEDFLKKYKTGEESSQIIGHFGLGFYSSFMVSDKVEIDSLSYQEGSTPAKWVCDGSPEFTISKGTRDKIGTEVKLYISKDERDFLEETRIKHILKTYSDFLPVPIKIGSEIVNKQKPLWDQSPTSLKNDDYINFYHYLYPFSDDPLFWIHLNVDYPFNLKGILYFPKIKHEFEVLKGKIKLYCNKVFVTDNIEDIVPQFLTNLQGALDCPDIPLNVSRSMLQNDPYVRKISTHITKKVGDKLKELYQEDKDKYIKYWEDIHPFIKFGIMSDDKFYEQTKDIVIFKSSTGEYTTIKDYLERNKEKNKNRVYYTSDAISQSTYLNLFKSQGLEVLTMDTLIDSHFVQFMEMKNNDIKFARIDSDISEDLVDKEAESKILDPKTHKTFNQTIEDIFRKNLDIPRLKIKVENLKSEDIPAMIILPEQMRRLKEMTLLIHKKTTDFLEEHTLVVNASNPVVKNLKKLSESFNKHEKVKLICDQIYDLALISQKNFDEKIIERFIDRSNKVLKEMSEALITN